MAADRNKTGKFVINMSMDDKFTPEELRNLLIRRLEGDGFLRVTVVGVNEETDEEDPNDSSWMRG